MATRRWLGGAPAVAQVTTFTVGGTIEVGDKFKVSINGQTLSTAATTTVAATTASEIKTTLAASTIAEFLEITWTVSGAVVTGTAAVKGKPYVVTSSTTESDDTAADLQTFVQATTVASSGPKHWGTAANWSGATVPVSTDDVYLDNAADILYDLDQNAVTLTSLTIPTSFGTAQLGLPDRTATGYGEYREQYLKIGATTVNIDCQSGRIKINAQAVATTVNVNGTGAGLERGLEALIWKGTNAANVVNVNAGRVDVAPYGGEVATIATLRVGFEGTATSDAVVRLSSGVTLTTINKTGGTLTVQSNSTTINHYGGTTEILAAATLTTGNVFGGTLNYRSSGTITALNIHTDGHVDFRGDPRTKAVSACDVYGNGRISDHDAVVTWTAGIDLNGIANSDRVQFGRNRRLTPGAVA